MSAPPSPLFSKTVLTVFPCPDVQWECKASLPSQYRLGRTIVSCEGYDYPEDEFVSCFEIFAPFQLIPSRLCIAVLFSPDPADWNTRFLYPANSNVDSNNYFVLCSWNMNRVTKVLAPLIFVPMMTVVSTVAMSKPSCF